MHNRDFTFRVKALGDEGTFQGLASPYGGPPDLVGDIIAPGAYEQAIASQGSSGFPLLFSHRQDEPLGLAKISDSPKGLVVDGSMVMADPVAQRVYAHLKAGSIKGLSIGYTVDPAKAIYGNDGTRTLTEVRLFEISLVAVPCAQTAQVTSLKSLSQVERLLSGIKHGDVTDDAALAAQLRGIDATLKSLLRKNTASLCECDCEECLAGDCADCSNDECVDPNCEGTKARQAAEELAMLKNFAASMKSITGGRVGWR